MVIPSTIDELIQWGKDQEISYRNMNSKLLVHDTKNDDVIRAPIDNLLTKYRYYLDAIVSEVTLPEVEFTKYYCNPKLLSERLYGTPEFWSGLLAINHCISVIDFTSNTFKFYDPLKIRSLINEILILEDVIS